MGLHGVADSPAHGVDQTGHLDTCHPRVQVHLTSNAESFYCSQSGDTQRATSPRPSCGRSGFHRTLSPSTRRGVHSASPEPVTRAQSWDWCFPDPSLVPTAAMKPQPEWRLQVYVGLGGLGRGLLLPGEGCVEGTSEASA